MGDAPNTPRGVQLLIVGNSHVNSYGGHMGRSPDDYEMNPIDEARGFWRIGGDPAANLGYWDAAVELAKTFRTAVCWQGNQHVIHFMFLDKRFDFALASHPELVVDPGVEVVPELRVREVFQPSMSHLEMVLTQMLDTGGQRPIVLGTPPPKGDNEAIRRGMQVNADVFAKIASDLCLDPEEAQLAPACLRLKLWWLLQQMMRETAERLALEFWPVSASAMTEEGYLRPAYWGEDATHANAAYGALMLDEYEKRLSENEEFTVRASSESGPDLLPRGRFLLRDWPPEDGILAVIEAPKVEQLRPPEFVYNLSGKEIPDWVFTRAQIHGSYLVSRSDVLLFGPNYLVSQSGLWSCETRTVKRQYMEFVAGAGFSHSHPGVKPSIELEGDEIVLDCNTLSQYDVDPIAEPVFLATPLEPDNWGRWIATVLPKCVQFKVFGNGRTFFCRTAHPWQRDLLQLMGIEEAQVLEHDPGKSYFCRDALTVEYSAVDMSVSEAEQQVYADLADACRRDSADNFGERIFVSRLSTSAKHPWYRVLQNECDLIAALGELGFKTVQPEKLPLKEQIGMFARAKCVVALGGSALYNVRFCPPGTTVVTIESSDYFIRPHAMMLSSMGHRFGVIFGQQDPADPEPVHKRWTIDVQRACTAIREIL